MNRTSFTAYFSPDGTMIPSTVRYKAGDSNDALKKLYWPNKPYKPEECEIRKVQLISSSKYPQWEREFDWVEPCSLQSKPKKLSLEDEIWL